VIRGNYARRAGEHTGGHVGSEEDEQACCVCWVLGKGIVGRVCAGQWGLRAEGRELGSAMAGSIPPRVVKGSLVQVISFRTCRGGRY
jgi:hypothetical protein